MKKYILVFQFIIMLFSITNAQIGGAGGGSTGGSSGSGGSGSGGGISPNININVNRNTPTQPGTSLYGTNTAFERNGPNGVADRYVFWLHGLNGGHDSWHHPASCSMHNFWPTFPARKLTSSFGYEYGQGGDMNSASTEVEVNVIEPIANDQIHEGKDPTRNFIIGHSQGGIVARSLLRTNLCVDNINPNQMGFGGIVTVCSPNQGARLLSNRNLMSKFSDEMCVSLGSGPLTEFGNKDIKIFGFTIGTANSLFSLEEKIDVICDQLSKLTDTLVVNKNIPQIAKDYEVGSNHMNLLNNGCSENLNLDSFPKVAFYGVEPDTGLMLRNAQYFLTPPNTFDPFQANDDMVLINSFNKNYKWYKSKVQEKVNAILLLNVIFQDCFYSGDDFCMKIVANDIIKKSREMIAYEKGVKWYESFDDQYKRIIGVLGYDTITENYYKCTCTQSDGTIYSEYEVSSHQECDNDPNNNSGGITCNTVGPIKRVRFIAYKKESDGTVLAESAMNLPKATMDPVLLKNTSHMQARNNEAIRLALIDLYNGTDKKGKFFATEIK